MTEAAAETRTESLPPPGPDGASSSPKVGNAHDRNWGILVIVDIDGASTHRPQHQPG
jgi:hypothetical protein